MPNRDEFSNIENLTARDEFLSRVTNTIFLMKSQRLFRNEDFSKKIYDDEVIKSIRNISEREAREEFDRALMEHNALLNAFLDDEILNKPVSSSEVRIRRRFHLNLSLRLFWSVYAIVKRKDSRINKIDAEMADLAHFIYNNKDLKREFMLQLLRSYAQEVFSVNDMGRVEKARFVEDLSRELGLFPSEEEVYPLHGRGLRGEKNMSEYIDEVEINIKYDINDKDIGKNYSTERDMDRGYSDEDMNFIREMYSSETSDRKTVNVAELPVEDQQKIYDELAASKHAPSPNFKALRKALHAYMDDWKVSGLKP